MDPLKALAWILHSAALLSADTAGKYGWKVNRVKEVLSTLHYRQKV